MVFSFIVLFTGCATKERIIVDDAYSLDALNERAGSGVTKVVLSSGEVYLVSSLQVAEDSTRFTGKRVGRTEEVRDYILSTDQIKRVRLQKVTPKIGNGMVIGVATSFSFGFAIGYIAADAIGGCRWKSGNACFEEAATVGGLFGLGGGVLGGLVGAAHRRIQVYTLHLSQ